MLLQCPNLNGLRPSLANEKFKGLKADSNQSMSGLALDKNSYLVVARTYRETATTLHVCGLMMAMAQHVHGQNEAYAVRRTVRRCLRGTWRCLRGERLHGE